MTEQLSIDFEPRRLARSTDPQTSHEAATRAAEFSSGHHEQILKVLRHSGPATSHEIADESGLEMHAVARRMKELSEADLIAVVIDADGNPLTRKTPSGRSARVWFAK